MWSFPGKSAFWFWLLLFWRGRGKYIQTQCWLDRKHIYKERYSNLVLSIALTESAWMSPQCCCLRYMLVFLVLGKIMVSMS